METLLFNDKWIAVHGQHVKIDDEGDVVAGNPKALGKSGKSEKTTIDIPLSYGESHTTKIITEKKGLALHKGAINVGWQGKPNISETNHYKISHIATGVGLTLGDGFSKRETAKKYLEALTELADWSEFEKQEDVPQDIKEKAFNLEAKFKKEEKETKNAKEFPKIFYCRHMLPGIARYENINPETKKIEEEHLFIDVDAMKQSAPSMVGKPIYVQHQKVNLATLQDDADGYVTECFYNELDGWLWAKFLAVSDEAQQAVARKWSVSNAYIPQEWDGKGSHLNVDYDKKIRKHDFTHLAIVPNPRYEDAKIFTPDEFKDYQAAKRSELDELQNSKPNEGHPMFKFFQKKDEELKNGIPADADLSTVEIELEGGKRVPLSEIINAVKKNDEDEAEAKKAKEEDEKKNKGKMAWNDDTMVTVGEEKMPMKDLMNKYNAMCKKNAEEDEKKKEKENAESKKKEEEEAEKADKEKKEKENSANKMKEMLNAHNKAKVVPISTVIDKKKRGSEMFGSAKK